MRSSTKKTPYLIVRQSSVPKPPLNREERVSDPKQEGGLVQGKKAYATEMMWAKGLEQANIPYLFQFEVPTAYTLPGKGKQVDFLVDGVWADEIDGEIGHKTESQRLLDAQRDILISENLHALGINNVRRIDAERFLDQKRVNNMVREYYR